MAHLVEIYKGLNKVRKVQPISIGDFPKELLDSYVENSKRYYEKRNLDRRKSFPGALNTVPVATTTPAVTTTTLRRLRRKTVELDTIEEGKPLTTDSAECDSTMRHRVSINSRKARRNDDDVTLSKGSTSVVLKRKPGNSLGLGIAGGSDKNFPPVVSYLRAGSIAHRSDAMLVGDALIGVNDVNVTQLKHDDILTLLRNGGEHVKLDLEYNLNEMYFGRPPGTYNKATDVVLEKESGSFGFTMRGGSFGPDPKKCRPLTVAYIRPGGPADREGRLRTGDRVLSIGGVDVFSATLNAAQRLLLEVADSACLTVEYDVSILETVKSATGPLLLEIDKPQGVDLGLKLSLITDDSNRRKLLIDRILPASIADRCGALHPNDELIAIDGITLELTTLAEVNQLLRGVAHSGQIKLEIVPQTQAIKEIDESKKVESIVEKSQKKPSRSSTRKKRQVSKRQMVEKEGDAKQKDKEKDRVGTEPPSTIVVDGASRSSHHSSNPSLLAGRVATRWDSFATQPMSELDSIRARSRQRSTYTNLSIRGPSQGSLSASVSGIPSGQVCHCEVMEVTLNSWVKGGYGFILHKSPGLSDHTRSPLFISYIERGSPAEKSGVLQVGDRVLAINDWCTANGTTEEANHIVRHATGPLTLTVEFDVIETVLPSSGVFTVKLAKRGQNLGIVITSHGSGMKGEPVIVHDIRTGSVSHRCGSIHPGDQLLSIDNIPLDTCTVEEAVRLLQRSADIVKLRVRKSSAFLSDDADSISSQTVVYSIELNRKGGALGITVASTDEGGDPVVISQLAPGGLAERTGALHVSDRILAINGQSLQGKRMAEAMEILQSAGDVVTLKIARFVDPPYPYQPAHHRNYGLPFDRGVSSAAGFSDHHGNDDKLGTPVQSIDSAVESLEDSPQGETTLATFTGSTTQQNQIHAQMCNGQDKYVEELSIQLQSTLTNLCKLPPRSSALEAISLTSSNERQSSDHGADSGLGSSDSGTNPPDTVCGCSCQENPSEAQEEWMRVLEALETVGEAEMLRKLEETILQGAVPIYSHKSTPATKPSTSTMHSTKCSTLNPPFPLTNTILRYPNMANAAQPPSIHDSRTSLNSNHSTGDLAPPSAVQAPPTPPPKPGKSCLKPPDSVPLSISTVLKSYENIPYITSPLPLAEGGVACFSTNVLNLPSSSLGSSQAAEPASVDKLHYEEHRNANLQPPPPTVLPLEIIRVTLRKDHAYSDFGFSVSDGVTRKGVYINKVRPGGPADMSGTVKPFDRILQVNESSLEDMDCLQAVPLLLTASERLDLLLCRDASIRPQSIIEEDEDENSHGLTHASV